MAHVFIVNERTFKVHLEYLFAGTGASDVSTDFIFDNTINIGSQDEKRSVGMITDLARIRRGDKIIFFVTGISKFFGTFEAIDNFFVDPNDDQNYLFNELGKKLTYRILIKPYKIYAKGLSEFDYLDSFEDISYPDELCWSLIYRKLDGNRGCTMINDFELELFNKKIQKNNILLSGNYFSYNSESQEIVTTEQGNQYLGRMNDVQNNMATNGYSKYVTSRAFEHYVQFITIETLKNNPYRLLDDASSVTWIGNEVNCGFGLQRIDCLSIQETDKNVYISVIELKDERIREWIIAQIDRYLVWLKYYIIPQYLRSGKKVFISPIIVSDCVRNNRQSSIDRLNEIENKVINFDWSKYNSTNVVVKKTKIVHFNIDAINNKLYL